MQKVEYRCYECMIVEFTVISDFQRSLESMVCGKCGGDSKRIGVASIIQPTKVDSIEIGLKDVGLQRR